EKEGINVQLSDIDTSVHYDADRSEEYGVPGTVDGKVGILEGFSKSIRGEEKALAYTVESLHRAGPMSPATTNNARNGVLPGLSPAGTLTPELNAGGEKKPVDVSGLRRYWGDGEGKPSPYGAILGGADPAMNYYGLVVPDKSKQKTVEDSKSM